MKKYLTLPEGYALYREIDLKRNKKEFWGVNVGAYLLTVLLVLTTALAVPMSSLIEGGFLAIFFRFLAIGLGHCVCTVLHEGIHGIFFWIFGGVRPHFGLSLTYAYAGSTAYFRRLPYLWITLSPVVILGAVLSTLSALSLFGILPPSFFWVFYFLTALAVGGAAGDFYVSYRLITSPPDLLAHDTGCGMKIYIKEED